MSDPSLLAHVAAAAAAMGAGAVNAIAGGGTLISFPVLTACGVPAVAANATSTVALCPGHIGGSWALRREIAATREPLAARLVVGGVGGVVGAVLLLATGDAAFRSIVPFLILLACALLVAQEPLRARVGARPRGGGLRAVELVGTFAAAVYGGYFGAGLGIMLLAVLGLASAVPFTRLNAVKQPLALVINLSAAILLMASGEIEWTLVALMAPAGLIGGAIGGRVSMRVPADRFKWMVVTIGVVVAIVYFVR